MRLESSKIKTRHEAVVTFSYAFTNKFLNIIFAPAYYHDLDGMTEDRHK